MSISSYNPVQLYSVVANGRLNHKMPAGLECRLLDRSDQKACCVLDHVARRGFVVSSLEGVDPETAAEAILSHRTAAFAKTLAAVSNKS